MITYTDNTITSLFDAQYDLSVLRADIKESQESSDAIISKLADALYAKALGEEVKDFVKPKVRYVVEDSEKLYKAIKNRAIKSAKAVGVTLHMFSQFIIKRIYHMIRV